jgi:hypothetical protein
MCWYSTNLSQDILQAEAGQRLGIRKVHGCSWVVRESDLHKQNPTPVCMIDGTTVLFRFPEPEQVTANTAAAPEAKAVFRQLVRPKRDVFQFSDGHETGINTLTSDLIFDVLSVPGKGEFSTLFEEHREEAVVSEATSERRPLLEHILQLF